MTTRGAFVSGRRAGISAYKHKDTILKETRQLAPKSTHSLIKKSVPGLNDQPIYIYTHTHTHTYTYWMAAQKGLKFALCSMNFWLVS